MKKFYFLYILFIINSQYLVSQCGIGGITFTRQGEVDSFPFNYPGCHRIYGNINIVDSEINNLDSLYMIDSIDVTLNISNNNKLTQIRGLRGLKYLETLIISDDTALINLGGLENLKNASNGIGLYFLPKLINLNGLNNLVNSAQFYVGSCDNLKSLKGLDKVTTISTLRIIGNPNLDSLTSFKNANFARITNLHIHYCPKLKSLRGLESCKYIWDCSIQFNMSLKNLEGLDSMNRSTYLIISDNDSLSSIQSLSSLRYVSKFFKFSNNKTLQSLNGIQGINMVDLDSIIITNNPLLNICHFANVCDYINDTSNHARIFNNLGPCQNSDSIKLACLITPLALELLSFTAYNEKENINIEWMTANERNHKNIILERKTANNSFHEIGQPSAYKKSADVYYYNFTDTKPEEGNNYYRLAIFDNQSKVSYSKIIQVLFQMDINTNVMISLSDSKFIVHSNKSISKLKIFNQTGVCINTLNGLLKNNIEANFNFPRVGLYYLVMELSNGSIVSKKFIVN